MELNKIFIPSAGIDLVFNLSSLTPYAKSSIIYDIDYNNQAVIIAQPLNPVTLNAEYDEIHITAVTQGENGKTRVGLKCEIENFIKGYRLAGSNTVDVIQLKFFPPLTETANIRAAYRLPLGSHFAINGKIIYLGKEYITKKDFIFRDVSFAGAGIICPKTVDSTTNPLTHIKIHDSLKVGMILMKSSKDSNGRMESAGIIPAVAEVTRLNINFSETHIFIGMKFSSISSEKEDILISFIHQAQVDDLQRLSRL